MSRKGAIRPLLRCEPVPWPHDLMLMPDGLMALDALDSLRQSGSVPSTFGKNGTEKLFVVTVRRRLVHLVEDDEQLRRLLGRPLRSSGFEVEEHE